MEIQVTARNRTFATRPASGRLEGLFGVVCGHRLSHHSDNAEANGLKRNFEFEPMTVICWGDRSIDLHNAYDLDGFGTNMNGSEVKLSFRRNCHAIKPDGLPSKVTLTCSGNVRLAFNDLSAIAVPINNEGIEIAYFDEGCDWLSCMDEEMAQSQEPLGLHVSFINGLAFRIFCDEARLATE